jgi:hypothetical protein
MLAVVASHTASLLNVSDLAGPDPTILTILKAVKARFGKSPAVGYCRKATTKPKIAN